MSSPINSTKTIAAIPCFNTENTIADIVSRTKKYVDEIIVVDDGSTDMTTHQAEMAGAKVIHHEANMGYGGAIKSCFNAARENKADVLVIIDGDGQHNPDGIPVLLDPIYHEKADLVIGSRFLSSDDGIPRYRKFGINMITGLWNFGSKVKVSDSQSGFRAFNKILVDGLEFSDKGMGVSIEILEKVRRGNFIIKEVPISCSYADSGSHFSLKAFYHGISVVFSVLRFRM
jgi:glycosyltransferase involved in cell wall biosynthesis